MNYPVGSIIRTACGMTGTVTHCIVPGGAEEHGELEIAVTAVPSDETCVKVGDLEHIAIYHPDSKWYREFKPPVRVRNGECGE